LRLLALATAISVLFALAPTCLKFRARNRTTYGAVAAGAGVQLVLLLLLVPWLGATGAAIAYTAALGGLYAGLALAAWRDVVVLSGN
jgi:O-antigen/teichoic acid export membrane protein